MAKRTVSIMVMLSIIVSMMLAGCGGEDTKQLEAEQKALIAKNAELLQLNQQLEVENRILSYDKKSLSYELQKMHLEIEKLKRRHEFWKEENKKYVVIIKIKEFHYSFSPTKYIKDEMNAITIPIQVSKAFFDAVKEGDKLNDKLRIGSILFTGNFGEWDITIKEKKIVENI